MVFKVGDKVAYAKRFLKNIGTPLTSPWWRLRGTITEVEPHKSGDDFAIATVKWDQEPEPVRINIQNLAIPGPNLRFAGD